MKVSSLALMLSVVLLSACDTSVTPSYQVSSTNTIALQPIAASGKKARVAKVSLADGVDSNPSCRLMGPLDVGGGLTPEEAIKEALTAELLAGGVYSANGAPITLTLTKMEPSSMSGYWILAGTVATTKLPSGFPVEVKYDFKTSFSAISACQNTAIAFNRAAASFINSIITNPSFRSAL